MVLETIQESHTIVYNELITQTALVKKSTTQLYTHWFACQKMHQFHCSAPVQPLPKGQMFRHNITIEIQVAFFACDVCFRGAY